jgi:hypothetical protein
MSGSGKEGNNRGKPFRRRERDADFRYVPPQESGRSPPNFEKFGGPGAAGKQGNHGRRGAVDTGYTPAPLRKWSGGILPQDSRRRDKKVPFFDRPKWTPPQLSTEPIPHPICPYCGKPIKDMSAAIADRDSGEPSHFECIAERIAEGETLESGDAVAYIGGGRFGVVHFPGIIRDALKGRKNTDDYDTKDFQIKKILEWEDKENRASWRKIIEEHFSVI